MICQPGARIRRNIRTTSLGNPLEAGLETIHLVYELIELQSGFLHRPLGSGIFGVPREAFEVVEHAQEVCERNMTNIETV